MAPSFALIRLVVLFTVVVFSLIALGMAAAVTLTTQKFLDVDFSFADLGIATAVLTMITVLPMIALEILRPGGPTSMIIAEIPWLAFLSILWLSTGAEATEFNAGFWFACGRRGEFTLDNFLGGDNICSEVSALQAFGFLNWIICA
ncbi:hypothetical protein K438DRAFT_1957302 [Mycena galopus ATCC 62051]|nr:hypothetical protein K438DRAFT_1957302 [Mycena galopus ATCC 62051]